MVQFIDWVKFNIVYGLFIYITLPIDISTSIPISTQKLNIDSNGVHSKDESVERSKRFACLFGCNSCGSSANRPRPRARKRTRLIPLPPLIIPQPSSNQLGPIAATSADPFFSFPSLPALPDLPSFPALPSFPQIPDFPPLPAFPELPIPKKLPRLPNLPALPKLPSFPSAPFPPLPPMPPLAPPGGLPAPPGLPGAPGLPAPPAPPVG
ncbi:protein PELPK1-like [Tetranychus urticae]|uniref:Uncharacterized protein n=1 Tax=Tetranychus urticae TaxID=32264 RepID=T1JTR2_TETUR|nr:protein PELPK1-like [Tetranychus urticae]